LPRPTELAARAEDLGDGRRAVVAAIPAASLDELKGLARDTRGALGDGVIALALDAEEPQLFVTVSEDLVGKGVSAGDLVRAAMPSLAGKGGGRPEMAQGRGTRREGLSEALAAIRAALSSGA
jgi:alanyl-tRNA synthetase